MVGFYSKQNRKPLEGYVLRRGVIFPTLTVVAIWRKDYNFGGIGCYVPGDGGWRLGLTVHSGGIRRGWI